MKFIPVSICSLVLLAGPVSNNASAQVGGDNTYEFLNLPVSARVGALGGNAIATKDDDISLSYHNPALLDSGMSNKLAFNYINYFSDVNFGYAGYAKHFKKVGTFSVGMQFLDYGKFTQADETGLVTGQFSADESCLNLGYGRKIDSSFSVGANLKTIYSNLAGYTSIGSAIDLAGMYYNRKRDIGVGLVVRNIGMQWKTYANDRERLPFEAQIGISKKPEHVPFRFSLIYQHLERWDMRYDDPLNPQDTIDPLTGEEIPQSKGRDFADNFARHLVFNGEFILTKNFNIRLGYNYQRRKELMVTGRHGMIGFSFGFGFKISRFHISYGRASYHLAGKSNHFTLTTNLSDFGSKK